MLYSHTGATRACTSWLFSRLLRFIRRTRVTRDPLALIRALIACDYPGNYPANTLRVAESRSRGRRAASRFAASLSCSTAYSPANLKPPRIFSVHKSLHTDRAFDFINERQVQDSSVSARLNRQKIIILDAL